MALVTVIIPILNAMPFLPEALASLEAQKFRDFEVWLWDNGSKDGSVEEAKHWIPLRLRGRVVTGNPLPLHECLARMVEESRTELIARMDGDDICLPDRFEKQMAAMRGDSGLAAVGGQMDLMDGRGDTIGKMPEYPTDFCEVLCRILIQSPLSHPSVMMRRSKVLEAGNYRVPKPMEDFDLWFRLASVGKIENLPDKLLKYRMMDTSITNQSKRAGEHESEVKECVRRNLGRAFDIPESAVVKLVNRQHPVAFLPMLRAARRISNLSGVDLRGVLARPEFLFSARCYTWKLDVFSKLVYRFWARKI
jgi:glycosyltransferase involved in cell wall biosynthesis